MATFRERNGRWQAIVRKANAKPLVQTFDRKYDAEQWANEIERKMDRGGMPNFKALQETTVRDVLDEFKTKVVEHRKGWKHDCARIEVYKRERWSYLRMSDDIASALRDWRDERLKTVKPQSVNRDLNLLSSAFGYAMSELGLPLEVNPVKRVKRPKVVGGERDVTWTEEQLVLFLDHFGWDIDSPPELQRDFTPWVLLIAKLTGMRRSEICAIEMEKKLIDPVTGLCNPHIDFDIPGVYLPDTKNGDGHTYPLGSGAVRVLKKLVAHRKGAHKLIGCSADSITTYMTNARKELVEAGHNVGHLRVHDLRHTHHTELLPRLTARGGTQLDMLRITGRRTMQSLARYYNPKPKDLVRLLD
ncbi:MAG TPA: tyrosine-type recombinase/integrase [Aquabacterium sp.]|nr:tyrosine-type recombinase/integrase [Aquabacterium sp.]